MLTSKFVLFSYKYVKCTGLYYKYPFRIHDGLMEEMFELSKSRLSIYPKRIKDRHAKYRRITRKLVEDFRGL
jgi:hypothetical protein